MRILAFAAALALALPIPTGAEAAKARFSSKASAKPAATRSSVIVVPGLSSRAASREPTERARVPFPPATNLPAPQRVNAEAPAGAKPWCQGATVVGGFCVVN